MLDYLSRFIFKCTSILSCRKIPIQLKVESIVYLITHGALLAITVIVSAVVSSIIIFYRSVFFGKVVSNARVFRECFWGLFYTTLCNTFNKTRNRSSRILINILSESSIVDGYLSKLAVAVINSSISWVISFLLVSNILEGFTWRVFNAGRSFFGLTAVENGSKNSTTFLKIFNSLCMVLVITIVLYSYWTL